MTIAPSLITHHLVFLLSKGSKDENVADGDDKKGSHLKDDCSKDSQIKVMLTPFTFVSDTPTGPRSKPTSELAEPHGIIGVIKGWYNRQCFQNNKGYNVKYFFVLGNGAISGGIANDRQKRRRKATSRG